MDFKVHYPQNTISHCIISNETQITLLFFQGRISAMPDVKADLFLAISNWYITVNFIVFFDILLYWFPADQVLKKVGFSTFF